MSWLLLGAKAKAFFSNHWVQGALLVVFVVSFVLLLDSCLARMFAYIERGAVAQERAETSHEALERRRTSDDVQEHVRRTPTAQYNECLLSAANPENCERLLREQ